MKASSARKRTASCQPQKIRATLAVQRYTFSFQLPSHGRHTLTGSAVNKNEKGDREGRGRMELHSHRHPENSHAACQPCQRAKHMFHAAATHTQQMPQQRNGSQLHCQPHTAQPARPAGLPAQLPAAMHSSHAQCESLLPRPHVNGLCHNVPLQRGMERMKV